MRIFFAGPLTELKNPEQMKLFYGKMADVAKELGFDYFWAFLNGTDPIKNPDVSPSDVYHRDITELDNSDMMIAYIGEPTTGTGIEIEHAHKTNKPIVILYEQGKHVSRMLRGCPGIVKEIVFSSEEDALTQLKTFLQTVK
jgi:2'-deoxynucleoside 5'-phosphate N-hydrolase